MASWSKYLRSGRYINRISRCTTEIYPNGSDLTVDPPSTKSHWSDTYSVVPLTWAKLVIVTHGTSSFEPDRITSICLPPFDSERTYRATKSPFPKCLRVLESKKFRRNCRGDTYFCSICVHSSKSSFPAKLGSSAVLLKHLTIETSSRWPPLAACASLSGGFFTVLSRPALGVFSLLKQLGATAVSEALNQLWRDIGPFALGSWMRHHIWIVF